MTSDEDRKFYEWAGSEVSGESDVQKQAEEALNGASFEAQVLTLPSFIYTARLREAGAQRELEATQLQIKVTEAWADHLGTKAVADAFVHGLVDGKNADERKAQMAQAPLDDEDYVEHKALAESLSERLPGLQLVLDVAKAHRRYLEDRQTALAYILRWREMEAPNG